MAGRLLASGPASGILTIVAIDAGGRQLAVARRVKLV
jgi:hypothetical protein